LAPYVKLAEDTGAHVAISHHNRKGKVGEIPDPEDALGSQAFRGSVDAFATYVKRQDDPDQPAYFTVTILGRDGRELGETHSRLVQELGLGGFAWPVLGSTRSEVRTRDVRARILETLENGEAIERKDLLKAIPGKASDVLDAIESLVRADKIERSGKGKRGDPYMFRAFRSGNGGNGEWNKTGVGQECA
ncbi:unnamed protein product, partial [marine sediment metagenome]